MQLTASVRLILLRQTVAGRWLLTDTPAGSAYSRSAQCPLVHL